MSSVHSVYSRGSPLTSPMITSIAEEETMSPSRALTASPSTTSVSSASSVLSLHCETPKNSPMEGNTRPGSPSPFSHRDDGNESASNSQAMKKSELKYKIEKESIIIKLIALEPVNRTKNTVLVFLLS